MTFSTRYGSIILTMPVNRTELYQKIEFNNLPSIQTYADATIANIRRNAMNKNVSKLFAVTVFTLYMIVFNNRPCEVLSPVRSTKQIHPLSGAEKQSGNQRDKIEILLFDLDLYLAGQYGNRYQKKTGFAETKIFRAFSNILT